MRPNHAVSDSWHGLEARIFCTRLTAHRSIGELSVLQSEVTVDPGSGKRQGDPLVGRAGADAVHPRDARDLADEATVTLLTCIRAYCWSSHLTSRSRLRFIFSTQERAPWRMRRPRWPFPRLLMPCTAVLPPVQCSHVTGPSHTARSRARLNFRASPTSAKRAVAPWAQSWDRMQAAGSVVALRHRPYLVCGSTTRRFRARRSSNGSASSRRIRSVSSLASSPSALGRSILETQRLRGERRRAPGRSRVSVSSSLCGS